MLSFHTRRVDLERRFATLCRATHPDGGLWIAWPKRASGVPTDITEDTVREVASQGAAHCGHSSQTRLMMMRGPRSHVM